MRFRIRWRGPSITFQFTNEPEEDYCEEEEQPVEDKPIGRGSGHNFERSWDEAPEDRVSGFGFQ